MKKAYGSVIKRATCFRCQKRRVCRIGNINGYYTAEVSGLLKPFCLTECSQEDKTGNR